MVGDEHAGAGGAPAQGASSLPVSRSFVLQFTTDTAPASQRFRGRVEHIDSGRSRRFNTLDDLAAFITEVLEANQHGQQV